MNYDVFYPPSIKSALENDPPGAWMPDVPQGCIRLSAGYPAAELVPTLQLGASIEALLAEEKDLPLQYIGSHRAVMLRDWIRRRLMARNMPVAETELLVTAGGIQAIDLIARVLLDATATVAVEAPTYMEALEIFQNYTRNIITIPVDERGMCTVQLEQMLQQRAENGLLLPRLVYTIPSFQNPTGSNLPLERRRHLLELAETFDFLILEDDAYGELSFASDPATLKSLDGHGRVLYVGSMSKVLGPGLRIGWTVAPAELIQAINWFKKDLDHAFVEASISTLLTRLDWNQHLTSLRNAYRRRRDVMLQALDQHMPETVTWHVPDGGYFIWLQLVGVDTGALLNEALQAGVSYVPGQYFFVKKEQGRTFLRLSFSSVGEQDMVEGVRRLADLVRTRTLEKKGV